jgi:hypothetical protein
MILNKKQLVNYLYKQWGWLYTKKQIEQIILEEGAARLDPNIKYILFEQWEIKEI